jgi:hypothetical protein
VHLCVLHHSRSLLQAFMYYQNYRNNKVVRRLAGPFSFLVVFINMGRAVHNRQRLSHEFECLALSSRQPSS